MWFQHDGAPAHFSRNVRNHLDTVYRVSSRPKRLELYEEKPFLHVLRRRPMGCPDSRQTYPIMPDVMDMMRSDID
ncbi:hypothetical protein TNCV_438751 [Trichonephila clavipes]|nr:hypothetical protein TNCV_438751 [Trichonephila clavipes]